MTSEHLATPELPRPFPAPLPLSCVVGETLCHVYVLSEEQWGAIPARRRQGMKAEYVPGLGWVVASPGRLG
jgi:hypothetical protein